MIILLACLLAEMVLKLVGTFHAANEVVDFQLVGLLEALREGVEETTYASACRSVHHEGGLSWVLRHHHPLGAEHLSAVRKS